MKQIILLSLLLILIVQSQAQQFTRADSYDITNSNEVAALTSDSDHNIYISGVYNASVFLPYTGNCYLMKTDADGNVVWTKYFTGAVQIGDIVASGNDIVIIGQSNGLFSYDGVDYGIPAYHLFLMKVDAQGTMVWLKTDGTKNGSRANLVTGENGNIAMNIRGVTNIGDRIDIIDPAGLLLGSKQISTSTANVIDIAYFNNRVYINGSYNGQDSLVVDDIVIRLPEVENAAFVMALDDNLVAEWATVYSTINNRDGRIVCNENGIFAYFSLLEPPFTVVNVLKKFGFDGGELSQVYLPFFSTSTTPYPDMAITPDYIGMYVNNDFDFNSHKVILYNSELSLVSELTIDGLSDLYSGQITGNGDGIVVAHVHTGNLNFNNDITLPYSGTGKKPYIGNISLSEPTGVSENQIMNEQLFIYPNPSNDLIYIELPDFKPGKTELRILNMTGTIVAGKLPDSAKFSIDISHLTRGTYIIEAVQHNRPTGHQKLVVR